jgi:hypothetical protein
MRDPAMWGKLVRSAGETGFESFDIERTTLFRFLRRSRVLGFCAVLSLGLALGFVLGVGAVAWW